MRGSLTAAHILLAAMVAAITGYAAAEAGASLDSVTFIKYPNGVPALEAVGNGTLDMHASRIPADLVGDAMEYRNLQVLRTSVRTQAARRGARRGPWYIPWMPTRPTRTASRSTRSPSGRCATP